MENTTMPNTLRRLLVIFGILLIVSLLASGFSAVYVTLAAPQRATYVPSTVGFEGQLADAQGVPVADGNYKITFRLYAPNNETPLWTEIHEGDHLVPVADGLYSVQLGSITPFSADTFNGELFLGVQVDADGEMTPRIPISAVPFALNAEQARGLQGYNVAETAPDTNDLLGYNGTAWAPRPMLSLPDLAPVGSNASPNDLLQNYRSGAILKWKDANSVEATAGELMINGFMRRNTIAVQAILNEDLEAGDPQNNFTYDVYAVAPIGVSTFDLIITESGQAPTTVTDYRKLGSFRTADNANIIEGSASNLIDIPKYVPSVRVYNSSNIALPNDSSKTLTFNSEVWDNDNMHSITADTSRLTINTAGKYLVVGQAVLGCSTLCKTYLRVRLNGSTNIAGTGGDYGAQREIVTIYNFAVGEYIELRATRDNVGTGDAAHVDTWSPSFMMLWLGD